LNSAETFKNAYKDLAKGAREPRLSGLLARLAIEAASFLAEATHGDLPRWREALHSLHGVEASSDLENSVPVLGKPVDEPLLLRKRLMELHPWRKGPLRLGGVKLDTEWRSDWKWKRVSPHIDLTQHSVLDVGCGNGYFGWRMLGAGARRVIGIDPTLVFVMQWLACRALAGDLPNHVLPLRIEDLPDDSCCFDSVFSMGVLYHRRNPVQHLQQLRGLCRDGGQVVLETLVLDESGQNVLQPEGRYARMRNVHAIPTTQKLISWMKEAGLENIRILDVTATTTEEQRSTEWMHFESLDRSLDPQNPALTVEGYPAPVRAVVLARA
jgi:tRNA (mo5U34)-methyltransferase